jgi:Flp pilus assembly protein TadD
VADFPGESALPEKLRHITRAPHFLMAISRYTILTEEDYDRKLREMGNYLWELEQEADLASQRGDEPAVAEREAQIERMGEKARAFSQIPGRHQVLGSFIAGLANRMVRRWQSAADCFFAVVEGAPTNGEAWLELTWCLAEMGHWEECAMAARKSTELFPAFGAPWSNLAIALHHLGQTAEAESAINKALEFEPHDLRNQAIREHVQGGKDRRSNGVLE